MISQDTTSAILTYGISDANGNFSIKLTTDLKSFFLKISYVGYTTWKQEIQNKYQQLEIQLAPSSEELKEVFVESRIIEGITFGFQPGQKEKMMKEHKETLQKRNNPIELE